MKKSIKVNILRILTIAFMISIIMSQLIVITSNYSFADTNIGGVMVNEKKTVDTNSIEQQSSRIIGVIQVVGVLIAVGVIMVIGIKYMMGSAEEKAEYKKTLIPYLIGAILLFAASALAGSIYNIINGYN
ncbi:MAG: hypothetical protein HFJ17_01050 [Clostridia bacterium]|nr:hypothetical protein [Clostridia bacterium]